MNEDIQDMLKFIIKRTVAALERTFYCVFALLRSGMHADRCVEVKKII